MEKHLNIIWKKIDGTLSQEETLAFNQLLHSDVAFSKLYNSQLRLNNQLKQTPVVSAPSNLLNNVLSTITQPKVSYAQKYGSFGGMKVITFVSIALLLLSIILTLTLNLSLNFDAYPQLMSFMNSLSLPDAFSGIGSYSIYFLILVPGVVLYWMDKMFVRTGILVS